VTRGKDRFPAPLGEDALGPVEAAPVRPTTAIDAHLQRQVPGPTTGVDALVIGAALLGILGVAADLALIAAQTPASTSRAAVTVLALVLVLGLVLPGMLGATALEHVLVAARWLPPAPDAKARHALPTVERHELPAETKPTPRQGPWHPLELPGCVLSSNGRIASIAGFAALVGTGLASAVSPVAAAPLVVPAGIAAILAGLVATSSGRSLQEWEARAGAREALRGQTIPVDVQAVAARPLTVRMVTVSLWDVTVVSRRVPGSDNTEYLATHTCHDRREVPVEAPLLEGQALRLRTEVRLPPEAPVSETRGASRTSYRLRVDVDIPWLPDSYQVWRFLEVVDRPSRPELAPSSEVALAPAEHSLADLEVTCPFCGEPPGEVPLVACRSCDTIHHRDCWTEAEACTTYGCGETGSRQVLLVTPPQR
jgi:hypothetical protein